MRRNAERFSFRGFVALADLLFALSAGLLLLDPSLIQAKQQPTSALPEPSATRQEPEPAATHAVDSSAHALRIRAELKKAADMLEKLEAETLRIEQLAQQVLRSE